jgi:hypothetical protein
VHISRVLSLNFFNTLLEADSLMRS